MAKTDQLLKDLIRAHGKLMESHSFENTEPLREATIQRFEYTFELSWKVMSSILHDEGISVAGVRSVIREAARLGLIDDPSAWLQYADARNLSSHIYKEHIAAQVYAVARGAFASSVHALIGKAQTRNSEAP